MFLSLDVQNKEKPLNLTFVLYFIFVLRGRLMTFVWFCVLTKLLFKESEENAVLLNMGPLTEPKVFMASLQRTFLTPLFLFQVACFSKCFNAVSLFFHCFRDLASEKL